MNDVSSSFRWFKYCSFKHKTFRLVKLDAESLEKFPGTNAGSHRSCFHHNPADILEEWVQNSAKLDAAVKDPSTNLWHFSNYFMYRSWWSIFSLAVDPDDDFHAIDSPWWTGGFARHLLNVYNLRTGEHSRSYLLELQPNINLDFLSASQVNLYTSQVSFESSHNTTFIR